MSADSRSVCLIDDNDAFRQSTAWLLEGAGFAVQDFASGSGALHQLRTQSAAPPPDCIVCDVRMPGMTGLEFQEALSAKRMNIPLIFVTAHGDVPLAVEAMRKGAQDFIEKPFTEARLISAVNAAVDNAAQPTAGPSAEVRERLARLTPRERQVLDLVVDSKANKVIAAELGISIKTVELHRANMMTKMQARTLPALMKLILSHSE
ncbi:MAG: response regulator [Pseudomonadota bacterium]